MASVVQHSAIKFNYRVFLTKTVLNTYYTDWCHNSIKLWVILFTLKHIQCLILCIVYPLQKRKRTFCYCILSLFSDNLHNSCGLPSILHPARRNLRWLSRRMFYKMAHRAHKLNYLTHCNFVNEEHWNIVICYGRSIMDYNPLPFNNIDWI